MTIGSSAATLAVDVMPHWSTEALLRKTPMTEIDA
jgi:hypothetical protein